MSSDGKILLNKVLWQYPSTAQYGLDVEDDLASILPGIEDNEDQNN